jgi:predicted ATPase
MARGKKRKELRDKTNYWLRKFGFASKAEVKQVMENYYQMIVELVPKLKVNFADIGFGASQVIPIVVEGFHAPPGSTLLLEQPEIHLHPKAQADLGDLFIEIAKENKTLIVETHSEHLLSRVRRRIAEPEGKIKREDVAIYFFTLKEGRTQIQEIQLNELGQFEFEEWPEDFFEEDYKEASAHFEAIAKAKAGQTV